MLQIEVLLLQKEFGSNDWSKSRMLRYFPVALVTLIEVFVRSAIKDLIDHGSPFVERASELAKSGRFDFATISALYGRKVTLGEILSHFASLNSFAAINATVGTLIGSDFVKALASVQDALERKNSPDAPAVIDDIGVLCRGLDSLFQFRHIAVHEVAEKLSITSEQVADYISQTALFLKAADAVFWDLIAPGALLTQGEINVASAEEFEKQDRRLANLIQELAGRLDDPTSDAALMYQPWDQFREAFAHFEAGPRKDGGTWWPMIYCDAKIAVTKSLVDILQTTLEVRRARYGD